MKVSIPSLAALMIATIVSASHAAGTGGQSTDGQFGSAGQHAYTAKSEFIDTSPVTVSQDRVSIDFVLKQPRPSQKIRRY